MKNRRSIVNFSIKRKMQIRLFKKIMLISVVAVAIMATVFYFYSNREIGNSYRQFHVQANNFLDYLLPAVGTAIGLGIIASLVIAVFLPHKIAGPLFRIEMDLKTYLAEGDLTYRFGLRKGDEFTKLAETLNETVDELRAKVLRIDTPLKELEDLISNGKELDQKKIEQLVKETRDGVLEFKI